ncbi:MAG: N-acyl homoserine lactonase family protein [Acidobacteria bacterium]|nr:N-acyl homoserine lactonase family protein [Acidobacteriota bacterium]
MVSRHRRLFLSTAVALGALHLGTVACGPEQATPPARGAEAVQSVRLYVLDAGTLESDPARYQLKPDEVATSQLSVAAYLVVHPKGTVMWDAGAVADDSWVPGRGPVSRHLVLSNGQDRRVTIGASLKSQLASAGYEPADITYLALSHYHWDHVANANDFAGATWLVRQSERDGLFPQPPAVPPQPSTYAYLQNSKTTIISTDEYDVFGDGDVVIKSSPGHTPGHQVLYVKLAKTGGVVLSGDLYHYPEERTLNRLPVAEFDQEQTRRSRESLELFLKQTGAELWIQHDLAAHAGLRKAPDYYD